MTSISSEGARLALDRLMPNWLLTLRLHINDVTHDGSTTDADCIQPSGSWYDQRGLNFATWHPAVVESGRAVIRYGAAQTWTVSSGDTTPDETIRGWYMVDVMSGLYVMGQSLDDPVQLSRRGDHYELVPAVSMEVD